MTTLDDGRRWGAHRLGIDIALIVALALFAHAISAPWFTVATMVLIGAGPLHDALVQGHEATHRNASRRMWLNEAILVGVHAWVGLSGTAYRLFHLAHHRRTHTPDDPELELIALGNRSGLAYLFLPLISPWVINSWPLRQGASRQLTRRVALEMAFSVAIHVVFAIALGWTPYLLWCIGPIATGLYVAVVVRSINEHHGASPQSRTSRTRSVITAPWVDWIWSNVGHHLEHHLYPALPFHRLPAVRKALDADGLAGRARTTSRGFLVSALTLLATPNHYGDKAMTIPLDIAHWMRVWWFEDILQHPQSRAYLFSLYYAGEAYRDLHPNGVFIELLPEPYRSLLSRQLNDEDRHATLFESLLDMDGASPWPLTGSDDLGWHLLNNVVPDVVAAANTGRGFNVDTTSRYMAFLHCLELRSIIDLGALHKAAMRTGNHPLAQVVQDIIKDERFHASYTLKAVHDLNGEVEAQQILRNVRRAERHHYRQALRRMLERFEALGARPTSPLGALRWAILHASTATNLAFPVLPSYKRLPRTLTQLG